MKFSLNHLKNLLLTGWEKHPWGNRKAACRHDIHPGLKIIAWISRPLANGMPVIWKDSQLADAISNPQQYTWVGLTSSDIGTLSPRHFTFTSSPYKKEGYWYAKVADETLGEAEILLWLLGVVPDFTLRPVGNVLDPAGWNPSCRPQKDS